MRPDDLNGDVFTESTDQVGEDDPPVWDFSSVPWDLDIDLLGIGADLNPATLLSAYSNGLFPMGVESDVGEELGWWSPLERGVLQRGKLRVTKSLRKSARHFEVSVDRAFEDVVAACADPSRPGAWITPEFEDAYATLHASGYAHSVEVWRDDALVGGLYGVSIGGLFAGESMFHRERDASKVALWHLCEIVFASPRPRLIDVQWLTDHLASMGCTQIPRDEYRAVLPDLLDADPIAFRSSSRSPQNSQETGLVWRR